jgi:hypothetical protein
VRAIGLGLVVLVATHGCVGSHELVDGAVDVGPPPGILAPCPDVVVGISRDCGWDRGPAALCTPGAVVEVGCAEGCGLGQCVLDSMIRVCEGDVECSNASAIAQNDDSSCGGLCSDVSFRCPPSGRITVLTGPSQAWHDYRCNVVAR